MKNLLWILLMVVVSQTAWAQQAGMQTQFVYNKLAINPAYAGNMNAPCLLAMYRGQWLGLEGAPRSQMLAFDSPLFNKRVGVGLNLNRFTVGITEQLTADLAYAYRLKIGNSSLALGMQASIRSWGADYSDPRLIATQDITTDGGIPVGDQRRTLPNFGAGIYFNSNRFYLGVSAPRLIENNIDFNDANGVLSRETKHFFAMSGVVIRANDVVSVHPQILLRYAVDAPFNIDWNVNFHWAQRLMTGLTYRYSWGEQNQGESLDLLLAAQISREFLIGFSYDITLTDLRDYSSGSVEVLARYCFNKEIEVDIINPRFF